MPHQAKPGSAAPFSTKYEAPYSLQLSCLAARLRANATRHPMLIWLNFVATALMATAMGGIYWAAGRDTGGIQVRLPPHSGT